MTLQDYTHITLVCDRSGSMADVQRAAEEAVNGFIAGQKSAPGAATLLFVDFDAPGYAFNPLSSNYRSTTDDWYRTVFDGDIKSAPRYELIPRNGTALIDAAVKAIDATGLKLASLPEAQRPAKVIFVLQTDGQENSSRTYHAEALRARIAEQETKYNWEFVYLGMGLETIQQGRDFGFRNVTGTMANNDVAYAAAYSNLSATAAAYRGGASASMAATNVEIATDGSTTAAAEPTEVSKSSRPQNLLHQRTQDNSDDVSNS